MKNFFFDTADINFIKDTWNNLSSSISKELVVGITTNPNAFFKINKLTLKEWFKHLPKLCELVSEIRQDDKGIVYIQGPSANMTPTEILKYAEIVSKLGDGNTKVGLKIPPYDNILSINKNIQQYLETNVTGLADCSTALKCVTYDVNYISIIPGRMEEMGIDAKAQIKFLNQSNLGKTKIIAGSMRTLEQLTWTFQYNTEPTIGERVWPLILENNNLEKLLLINYNNIPSLSEFTPTINETNISLSLSFFNQMNKCGEQAYNDFKI